MDYNEFDYEKVFDRFKNNKILVIGDVMLDIYLIGKVDRISPEAPVPICEIYNKEYKLGGAANVTLNLKKLLKCRTEENLFRNRQLVLSV